MKKYKKRLILSLVVLAAALSIYKIYDYVAMARVAYYTQVTQKGQRVVDTGDSGKHYTSYRYQLTGYDKTGTAQTLDFTNPSAKPLKKEIYLKVIYEQKRGVIQWQPVIQTKIPEKAIAKLNQ